MTAALTHADILKVRDASRRMVRALGFMRPTLAQTDLSASAVHAIIEIGNRGSLIANQLGQKLLLEKSSVSRMLGRLIERGLVVESASEADGRSKILSLTADGQSLFADINRYANHQVGRALHGMSGDVRSQVVNGLDAYASALKAASSNAPEGTSASIDITAGFQPGAIGRIVQMQGQYYAREWNFPPIFEAKLAGGLADFVPRLGHPQNQIWLATQSGQIKGSAAIDGEDLGDGKAHLRWVIVDEALHGTGTGRKLVTEAVKFCDDHGLAEIHLWTFRGLNAARKLYESVGFELVEEWTGTQWGFEVPEQRFVRRK
jgi:DNA-binding MarR family transcriptional regulator/GNAT superfamily N-acetyltransferase